MLNSNKMIYYININIVKYILFFFSILFSCVYLINYTILLTLIFVIILSITIFLFNNKIVFVIFYSIFCFCIIIFPSLISFSILISPFCCTCLYENINTILKNINNTVQIRAATYIGRAIAQYLSKKNLSKKLSFVKKGYLYKNYFLL